MDIVACDSIYVTDNEQTEEDVHLYNKIKNKKMTEINFSKTRSGVITVNQYQAQLITIPLIFLREHIKSLTGYLLCFLDSYEIPSLNNPTLFFSHIELLTYFFTKQKK